MLIEEGLVERIVESLNRDDSRWKIVELGTFGVVGLQLEEGPKCCHAFEGAKVFELVADYFAPHDCWDVRYDDWLAYCDEDELLDLSIAVTEFLKRKAFTPTSYQYKWALSLFPKEV